MAPEGLGELRRLVIAHTRRDDPHRQLVRSEQLARVLHPHRRKLFAEPETGGVLSAERDEITPECKVIAHEYCEPCEAIVNGVRNWFCFPVIAHENKFLVSRIDLAKTIEPQLRPQMIQRSGKVQTIVLDPGHGGFDKGAASTFGNEKTYALDVARQLRPLLQAKGFKVVMTRETDVFIPLEVRARIANATKDSIFVSIHFNATGSNPAATGFEIFSLTPRGAPSTCCSPARLARRSRA